MQKKLTFLCKITLCASLICVCGCSQSNRSNKATNGHHIAWAIQGMSQSAELGALGVPVSSFQEREPNPNAYVGQLLFERYCAPCHSTQKAPDIIEHRVTQSDAESDYYIIRYGIQDMPGFRMRLTKFQVFDILAYMNTDFTNFTQLHDNSDTYTKRKKPAKSVNQPKPTETASPAEVPPTTGD